METSDAMDIEHDIFITGSAQSIAESLKRSMPLAWRAPRLAARDRAFRFASGFSGGHGFAFLV
jgi:hypothetical protein